jgi:hypothetical protein
MRHFFITTLAALCTSAGACSVTVDPLTVTRVTASPSETTTLIGVLGAVVTRSIVKTDGCDTHVSFTPAVLYVSSALDTCGRRLVLTHELQHVAIYRHAIETMPARIAAGGYTHAAALQAIDAMRAEHAAHDAAEPYHQNPAAFCRGSLIAALR